jgi:tetratricopeptide (TPR) repeat protein
MQTVAELLERALDFHRSGRLADAEVVYRQILQADPQQPDALHLLGVLAHQTGRPESAIELITRAIQLRSNEPSFYSNLGEAYRAMGRRDEAVACYRQAIALLPNFVDAYFNLGNVLSDQAKWPAAAEAYRQATRLNPQHASAHQNLAIAYHRQDLRAEAAGEYERTLAIDPQCLEAINNLGTLHLEAGQLDVAQQRFRQAISIRPLDANSWNLLGRALHAQQQVVEAQSCFRRALSIDPNHADAHNNLGILLFDEQRYEEAAASHRLSIALRPNSAVAHYNLGNALKALVQLEQAAASYRRALELRPKYADACNNLGTLLRYLGRPSEGVQFLERAIQIDPQNANAHFNLGSHRLMLGDFTGGWPEYEWRLHQADIEHRTFHQPRWQGEPLQGRSILLWAEQGFGDTLQFVRYAKFVKQRGGHVSVECQPELVKLLARSPAIDRCVAKGEPLPTFDVQASLVSLPGIFGTTLETIPAVVPYVVPDAELIAAWKRELPAFTGLKAGIIWQGNPRFRKDRFRSIDLDHFRPLAEVPGVQLFSLQKGAGREALAKYAGQLPIVDLADRLHDFDDTAAVLSNLDLLITSDTAPAHLAGALGVPVWLALGLAADWRWMLARDDSPWYPSMRLFRQRDLGNWTDVFERIRRALAERIAARNV